MEAKVKLSLRTLMTCYISQVVGNFRVFRRNLPNCSRIAEKCFGKTLYMYHHALCCELLIQCVDCTQLCRQLSWPRLLHQADMTKLREEDTDTFPPFLFGRPRPCEATRHQFPDFYNEWITCKAVNSPGVQLYAAPTIATLLPQWPRKEREKKIHVQLGQFEDTISMHLDDPFGFASIALMSRTQPRG